MFQGGDLKDQMLKSYIDQIFDKYDTDKSGTLDQKQMTNFFNDLFKSLGMNVIVNEQQALEAIKSIDTNYDGSINKQQLFNAFRIMLNTPPPPPPQPVYNYNPYGGYQAYQQPGMYNGQYMQPQVQPGYGAGYMGQPNPYMNTYGQQPMYQTAPQGYGAGYMAQSNTGYMNQSYNPQNPPQQQFNNPYNSYKK